MGVVASKICGGCFGGLGAASRIVPDFSPNSQQMQVTSMQDAMALERSGQGSFMPSPQARIREEWASPEWASPVPKQGGLCGTPVSVDCDFELSIQDVEMSTGGSLATQMDTDRPGRATAESLSRHRSRFEAEQLLTSPGSLPQPLSADEREAVIRSLLPTATFQMLAKLPSHVLKTASGEGQNLRRKLAKGATVVFVSAGLPGKRFTFERAASLGMKVVIIEHFDSWSKSLVDEGMVAKFLPVDMSQSSEAVFEQALAHIKTLGEDGVTGAADGIATFVELSVPLVARLCERLGLPGHQPTAVDAARNKYLTRAALKAAGLPTPRNFLITSAGEVEEAGRIVGFPAVLKPASGAASLGVKKVLSAGDLLSTYNEIIAELSTLVVTSGALVKGDAKADDGVDASNIIDLSIILEQYLDGGEVDVDIIMSGGEYQYAAVADNGPTMEPYFNETWAVCPSLLPKDHQRQLKELAIGSVKALGFTSGVFHVECKMTSTGPQLIEVNCRMGGGQVFECNLRAWGVDLVEETLFAALGIPSRPVVPGKPLSAVAYCYVNAPVSGRAYDLGKLETVCRRPGVVWAKPLVQAGAEVVGPEKGLPTWLCDLFVERPSAREALDFLHALEAEDLVPVTSAA